jgi:hypothetical protein
MNYVQIFGFHEQQAVERGEIEGDLYSDGDVYAEVTSLKAWRASTANSAAHASIPTLPISDAVTL